MKPRLTFAQEAMVDLVLQDPSVTSDELAEIFNSTRIAINKVINGQKFRDRVDERKFQLIDPAISKNLNERIRSVTIKTLDLVNERLDTNRNPEYALNVLRLTNLISKTPDRIPKAVKHNGNLHRAPK